MFADRYMREELSRGSDELQIPEASERAQLSGRESARRTRRLTEEFCDAEDMEQNQSGDREPAKVCGLSNSADMCTKYLSARCKNRFVKTCRQNLEGEEQKCN